MGTRDICGICHAQGVLCKCALEKEITDLEKEIQRLKAENKQFALIQEERKRQIEKWGEQKHDDYHWLAILTEEVGELAQAILHSEFGGKAAGTTQAELIQVAAVSVQWLEHISRKESKEWHPLPLPPEEEQI